MVTIFMKCQILFSGTRKKKYFKMSSAEILPRVLNVKESIDTEDYTGIKGSGHIMWICKLIWTGLDNMRLRQFFKSWQVSNSLSFHSGEQTQFEGKQLC